MAGACGKLWSGERDEAKTLSDKRNRESEIENRLC